MELTIQRTKADYKKFYKYYCFNRNLYQKVCFIILITLFFNIVGKTLGFADYMFNFIKTSIELSLILFVAPYFISIYRLQKAIKDKNYLLEKTKIIIEDTGIKIESDSYNTLWTWSAIKSVENSISYVFITLKDNKSSLFIEKIFFSSAYEATAFYDLIRDKLIKAKGVKSARHLYYWGLIGLIPNFGLIAGIILLYQGFFKYKDKLLIIIGISDILFTIVFWMIFRYEMSYGNWSLDSNAELALTEMNSLVKNIEFYKHQNGSYPDNLEQLIKKYPLSFTADPFLLGRNKTNAFFQYKKIRDKYTLFSIGTDRVPNTVDDIYPTVSTGDTVNFGFIKDTNNCP